MKMDVAKVWVLETDATVRRELLGALQGAAFLVRGFPTRASLQEAVQEERPDVLLLSAHLSASEERAASRTSAAGESSAATSVGSASGTRRLRSCRSAAARTLLSGSLSVSRTNTSA